MFYNQSAISAEYRGQFSCRSQYLRYFLRIPEFMYMHSKEGSGAAPMKEIEFTGDRIILREEVEVFGERDTEELPVEYDERDEFEVEIDTGGHVPLESLVDVDYTNTGDIASLTLRFDQLPSVQATARRRTSQTEGELPPVPDVEVSEIDVGGRRSFYERMRDSSKSQPAQIRQLIHEHQELEREEFDRLVDDELGYASDGGGTNMSLVILESVTEEIERRGRGDEQTIIWTGLSTSRDGN